MTPKARKLKLQTETLRNLTADNLARVVGGRSSFVADACSTWNPDGDMGCIKTNASNCNTGEYCSNTCY